MGRPSDSTMVLDMFTENLEVLEMETLGYARKQASPWVASLLATPYLSLAEISKVVNAMVSSNVYANNSSGCRGFTATDPSAMNVLAAMEDVS